jgi:hypothetical protein
MNADEHRHSWKKVRIRREDGSTRLFVAQSLDALNRSLETLRTTDLTGYSKYL